MAKYFTTPTN